MKVETKLNGVDVDRMMQTINAVQGRPELAQFVFRAKNRWDVGGHNVSTIQGFSAGGQEDQTRAKPFVLDCDEPEILLGADKGANPVEYVLHALAGCMTTSIVYHAAARGIRIDEVSTRLEGDLDLRGFLGISDQVRNGYSGIRVAFRIKADAPEETLDELVRIAQQRSPVFDVVSRPVPITVTRDKE